MSLSSLMSSIPATALQERRGVSTFPAGRSGRRGGSTLGVGEVLAGEPAGAVCLEGPVAGRAAGVADRAVELAGAAHGLLDGGAGGGPQRDRDAARTQVGRDVERAGAVRPDRVGVRAVAGPVVGEAPAAGRGLAAGAVVDSSA